MRLYNAIIQMNSQVISLYRNIILIPHLLALMLINLKKELACSWRTSSETHNIPAGVLLSEIEFHSRLVDHEDISEEIIQRFPFILI